MDQYTDAKMKQKKMFENKEQNNVNLMSSDQSKSNNGIGLQILCDATIIQSKEMNYFKELDLKLIRGILEVGPYGELKESIHQIRYFFI